MVPCDFHRMLWSQFNGENTNKHLMRLNAGWLNENLACLNCSSNVHSWCWGWPSADGDSGRRAGGSLAGSLLMTNTVGLRGATRSSWNERCRRGSNPSPSSSSPVPLAFPGPLLSPSTIRSFPMLPGPEVSPSSSACRTDTRDSELTTPALSAPCTTVW